MTKNQILYQELQQTKYRDEQNIKLGFGNLEESKRHNVVVETETERHNRVTESQNLEHLGIERYNAETNRLNYGVNAMNAETNRYNAETNRLNYNVNRYNAETNRLNYGVNLQNAESNRMQAQAALQNAATNRWSATANYLLGVASNRIAAQRMEHDYELGKASNINSRIQAQAAEMNAETNRRRQESEARLNDANIELTEARAYGQGITNRMSLIDEQYRDAYNQLQQSLTGAQIYQSYTQAMLNEANADLSNERIGESMSNQFVNFVNGVREIGGIFKNWGSGAMDLFAIFGG